MGLFPDNEGADESCTMFHGFTLWKNVDFGIYYNNPSSALIRNNVFVENGVGLFPFIFGPLSKLHQVREH